MSDEIEIRGHACAVVRAAAHEIAAGSGTGDEAARVVAVSVSLVRTLDTWCPFCGAVLRPVRHNLRIAVGPLSVIGGITAAIEIQLLPWQIACLSPIPLLLIVLWTTWWSVRDEIARRETEEAAMRSDDRGAS